MNLYDVVVGKNPQETGAAAPEPPRVSIVEARAFAGKLREEIKRREYFSAPDKWVGDKLKEKIWSKQREILSSLVTHRKTAVRSCHEVGKSFIAARAVAWWLDRDKTGDAFVVTSAPTGSQVKAILWREIGRAHTKGNLRGRVNQTSWFMPTAGGKEELVAFGRKPSDYDPTSFQGIHAPRVLVVFDEACGMPYSLFEAADSLIANDESKMLLIGNPDDPSQHFYECCKPGSGYNVIEIGAFDSPNFTGEPMPKSVRQQLIGPLYVEEKRRKWAPNWVWTEDGSRCVPPEGAKPEDTNPLWQSKILGKFPEKTAEGGLIPISWIVAAQQRSLDKHRGTVNRLGVDVGAGGDASCIAHNLNGVVRIIHEDQNPDTMQTCGKVVVKLRETGAQLANIDEIGIGKGVAQRGQELRRANEITETFVGVNVGRAALDPQHFVNLRAELYWHLREMFERGEIDLDPADDDTAAELVELRYKRLSNGKIQIESKDEMKRRGVPSPNRAEAIMLSITDIPVEEEWIIA